MKPFLLLIFLSVVVVKSSAQQKNYDIVRTDEAIKIDGQFDEAIWSSAPKMTDFIQSKPNPNTKASQASDVQITYDDQAIYVAATLWDDEVKTRYKELGQRDDLSVAADFFAIMFDTFDDDQNGFAFGVTAAGVQFDVKFNNNNDDFSFDAVWESQVRSDDKAWYVELKIPYYSLRFPQKEVQTWGVNAIRSIQRNQEEDFWNAIDPNESGFVKQWGQMTGLSAIKPPLRLSFTPFASVNLSKQGASSVQRNFNIGTDLKYGINESFTLDMTLIPDFGGVRSDEQILNLGPFEQVYDENREFFKEGIELFKKGNLFYTRRIGQRPQGYDAVSEQLRDNEIITVNPYRTGLINGLKVSGRTNTNWGLGVFNGITNKAEATILDTITQEKRQVQTAALTNYNVLVAEKALKNASSFYVINTNVLRKSVASDANVAGAGVTLRNKKNTYIFESEFAFSQINDKQDGMDSSSSGWKIGSYIGKTKAPFTFGIESYIENDTYNPNDLGLLFTNNEWFNQAHVNYQLTEEKDWYRFMSFGANLRYSRIYKPAHPIGIEWSAYYEVTFKNLWNVWANVYGAPQGKRDYFEPRLHDFRTYFKRPESNWINSGWSSNENKKLSINGNMERGFGRDYVDIDYWSLFLQPNFRLSNQLTIASGFGFTYFDNNVGFAQMQDDDPVFGLRKRKSFNWSPQLAYRFNENMNLSLFGRYNWDQVDYKRFYYLNQQGELGQEVIFQPEDEPDDVNFSALNLDFIYRWRFAPGSDIVLSYQKQIGRRSEVLSSNLVQNFTNLWQEDHGDNLNVKLIYFIDYNALRRKTS